MDFLRQVERPFVVVGTKADKLSSNQLNKSLALLKREHQLEEILPCSAKTSSGLKALWARMMLAGQK
jgi:GTP-binding protein